MTNPYMTDRKTMAVANELHAAIAAKAQAEGRSVYWLTNKLLADALKLDEVLKMEPQEEATR
jgi:predicted HicB family RNase H-like nuclease